MNVCTVWLTCGIALAGVLLAGPGAHLGARERQARPICISGVYPHLAAFSANGECGIGAVVPWAGRLWFITYPPHHTTGGPDKLYEIDPDLKLRIRPESVGGTHAGRMIHRESNQLIIGPYFIDAEGGVRAADVRKKLTGRMTAVMRHLTDPANKVYFYDMEGKVYEVDVHTLEVVKLFERPAPGDHGKGGYTAQGRVVIANNGERGARRGENVGALAEWDGKHWRVVERRQFCEVTGPGGIHGSPDEQSPLWATGWDRRSVILKLLDGGVWHTYRLPKASQCCDAAHGWYTEWPRIREIEPGRCMMDMHAMFYDFPRDFRAGGTAGLRPIATHLRMAVDYCHWNGRVVIASDDTSIMRNPPAGQSQSNLWFVKADELNRLGPPAGWGGPWLHDRVRAAAPSDPFLIKGFTRRCLHLASESPKPGAAAVTFTLEIDRDGSGKWSTYRTISVPPAGWAYHIFPADFDACWIRLRADKDCTATAVFHYSSPRRAGRKAAAVGREAKLFQGLADIGLQCARSEGIVRPAGGDNRNLQFLARTIGDDGEVCPPVLYEVDERMKFHRVDDAGRAAVVTKKAGIKRDFTVDEASVILSKKGRRYRLPKGGAAYDRPLASGRPRGLREVVTERSLLNCHGTFYEVPRADSAGLAAIRPIATHGKQISDFCTWRGLLVMAGARAEAEGDGHLFRSGDGVGLWFGVVDDLWKLPKPTGVGGPWRETRVKAGSPSDPYLMTGYDRKRVELSHDAAGPVGFTIEVDAIADGTWWPYRAIRVPPGKTVGHEFPDGFSARWVRVTADRDCTATARFVYE